MALERCSAEMSELKSGQLLWDRSIFTSELARQDGDFVSRNLLASGFSCSLRERCGRGCQFLERSLHFVGQKRGPLPFRQFRALRIAETRESPDTPGDASI
jgi:hypothetical protein